MAGVQIYTEAPISAATKTSEESSQTSSAIQPQPAHGAPTPAQNPASTAAPYAPQASFLTEPQVNPPTPTAASHPAVPSTSYAPPSTSSALQGPPPQAPQRSGSLTPSIPGSPSQRPTQSGSNLETPFVPRSRSTSPRRDIPPPPKAGEKMMPVSYYSPAVTPTYGNQNAGYNQGFPDQTGTTPNTATFAQQQQGLLSPHPNGLYSPAAAATPGAQQQPQRNWTSSPAHTPTTASMPTPAPFGQAQGGAQQTANFEHPPGYVQNPYAADMTPEQRFATQHGPRSPSLGYNGTPSGTGGAAGGASPNPFSNFSASMPGIPSIPGLTSSNSGTGGSQHNGFQGGMPSPNMSSGRGTGILDSGSDDGSVWGMVSGWAKTAGKKIGEVEGEVWKRINRDE